jgi:hypothetical protein
MSAQKADLGNPIVATRLREFFTKECKIVEAVQATVAERDEPFCDVLFPLLYSVVDSNRALSLLVSQGAMRSAYVVARVSFETIVNACFILTKGPEAAERARRHAQQKAFRDLDREFEISGQKFRLTCSAKDEQAVDPDLQASLAMFTNKKGREITQWTDENVKERIEEIGAKYGPRAAGGLNLALVAIYRHGSEIAHGSLFGALFSLGLTLPGGPKSGDQLARYIAMNCSSLLWFVGRSVNSLIYVVQQEMHLSGYHEKSQALLDEYQPGG